jgi:hypothetical protein
MNTTSETVSEADILDQLVTDGQPGFSAEAARALLSLRFSPEAVRRMNELAEKNRQGTLSEAERATLDTVLRVGQFLNVVQAKARLCLADMASREN